MSLVWGLWNNFFLALLSLFFFGGRLLFLFFFISYFLASGFSGTLFDPSWGPSEENFSFVYFFIFQFFYFFLSFPSFLFFFSFSFFSVSSFFWAPWGFPGPSWGPFPYPPWVLSRALLGPSRAPPETIVSPLPMSTPVPSWVPGPVKNNPVLPPLTGPAGTPRKWAIRVPHPITNSAVYF
jgi:hypothetical protein